LDSLEGLNDEKLADAVLALELRKATEEFEKELLKREENTKLYSTFLIKVFRYSKKTININNNKSVPQKRMEAPISDKIGIIGNHFNIIDEYVIRRKRA